MPTFNKQSPLPKSRKPRASEVVAWANKRVGKRLDIDGRLGSQCWDLSMNIIWGYWGIFVPGNANALAWYNYPKGWKKYKNTPSFVPKPGDIAVWSIPAATGHTAIVVGPSNKSTFTSIDQNWYNSNEWYGTPAQRVKHNYNGISAFIRPPYYPEKSKPKPDPDPKPDPKPDPDPPSKKEKPPKERPKYLQKKRTIIQYTDFDVDNDVPFRYLTQYVSSESVLRGHKPKGVYIRENNDFRTTEELYRDRNRYVGVVDFPHLYIDRNLGWLCKHPNEAIKGHEEYLVVEVCGGNTENKRSFMLNEVFAMMKVFDLLIEQDIKLSKDVIQVDQNIWRTVKEVTGHDIIKDGIPDQATYDKVKEKLVYYYENNEELRKQTIKTLRTTKNIKIKNPNDTDDTAVDETEKPKGKPSDKKRNNGGKKVPNKPKGKVTNAKSGHTFTNALNKQMRVNPQINNGWGWVGASRGQTSTYMNPSNIWGNSTQKYQMLHLGKYQGISVSKLNKILKGKGTLNNQGKAVAQACKKHDINEIYLIVHAFLESAYGTSNYASGRHGIYNYFGIGAYDWNPDYAITYARKQGWTTPAKGIIGGARFVRNDFINKGQNTLYRMRWNPKSPATHQYATDVRWCHTQAGMIAKYYKQIGEKGIYFIHDTYK